MLVLFGVGLRQTHVKDTILLSWILFIQTQELGLKTKKKFRKLDLVWRALRRANVHAVKEPVGLLRSDGKRPDGLMQIPWQAGKCMSWDVTVTDTLAESYLLATSSTAAWSRSKGRSRSEGTKIRVVGSHPHINSDGFQNAQTHQLKGYRLF